MVRIVGQEKNFVSLSRIRHFVQSNYNNRVTKRIQNQAKVHTKKGKGSDLLNQSLSFWSLCPIEVTIVGHEKISSHSVNFAILCKQTTTTELQREFKIRQRFTQKKGKVQTYSIRVSLFGQSDLLRIQ